MRLATTRGGMLSRTAVMLAVGCCLLTAVAQGVPNPSKTEENSPVDADQQRRRIERMEELAAINADRLREQQARGEQQGGTTPVAAPAAAVEGDAEPAPAPIGDAAVSANVVIGSGEGVDAVGVPPPPQLDAAAGPPPQQDAAAGPQAVSEAKEATPQTVGPLTEGQPQSDAPPGTAIEGEGAGVVPVSPADGVLAGGTTAAPPTEGDLAPAPAPAPVAAAVEQTVAAGETIGAVVDAVTPSSPPVPADTQAPADTQVAAPGEVLTHGNVIGGITGDASDPSRRQPVITRRVNPRRHKQPMPLKENPYEDRESWARHHDEDEDGYGGGGGEGWDPLLVDVPDPDDYYGLNTNWANMVDPAAFQPSHILQFVVPAGGDVHLFEDVSKEDVGKVVRGDWFVMSGDELALAVTIIDPNGNVFYQEGPLTKGGALEGGYRADTPTSQGSFAFRTEVLGTYTISITNPSTSYDRMVALAWLLGRDSDDPFGAVINDPQATTPSNTTAVVVNMMSHVSKLHKKLDDIAASQQYADVRFKRHMVTAESTQARLVRFTGFESAAILLSLLGTIIFFRRLNIKQAGFLGGIV